MEANTINETMTADEFADAIVAEQAITATDYFIRNRETRKLELHFEKSTYMALAENERTQIKSAFVWGRKSGCWISRAMEPNLHYAVRIAESIGLTDAGESGERLSFAEQMERKAERAERRAERFENASERAFDRGEALQKPINDMHGDIAFFTQPNINSSAGRAFTIKRERMWKAFENGLAEYLKSEDYAERAEKARRTARMDGLKSKDFIMRRIEEREADLRKLRRNVDEYESMLNDIDNGREPHNKYGWSETITREQIESNIEHWLDSIDVKLDELAYYQTALDSLGGVMFSKDNIKPGYVVNVKRWGNVRVMSTGAKNFKCVIERSEWPTQCAYAEIIDIISAKEDLPDKQPFKVGMEFTLRYGETQTVIKATDKTITMQKPDGTTYRVTPKYMMVPSQHQYMWRIVLNENPSRSWGCEFFYHE